MPTPLGPWDPAGGASSWGWPWESAFAIDPRASYGSVYAAWSELKDLCTAKTSEVVDASSGFFFPPSLAPPPPPRRPRSAPYWDLSEAVPQERAEHNSSMRWTNRCGVKPVVADVLHKASTVPDAPREALDETSAAPMGEPTANLGIYGSIPGIPESFTLSEFLEKEPPFSPASTLCYSRQAPVSPASTVYCCDRQVPVSPASTTLLYGTGYHSGLRGLQEPDSPASTVLAFEAPQPECDGGEESCSRCQHALGSSFDHRCPKIGQWNCSKAVCAKCNCETFRYACEDEAASGAMNDCKSLMLGAWKTALEACDFIGTTLAGAAETPAMPQPWTKETFSATQPQTPSLPSMLGHRRRVSQATDVYKTYLPGEIPCSPEVR